MISLATVLHSFLEGGNKIELRGSSSGSGYDVIINGEFVGFKYLTPRERCTIEDTVERPITEAIIKKGYKSE